jgi:hypothetical protein
LKLRREGGGAAAAGVRWAHGVALPQTRGGGGGPGDGRRGLRLLAVTSAAAAAGGWWWMRRHGEAQQLSAYIDRTARFTRSATTVLLSPFGCVSSCLQEWLPLLCRLVDGCPSFRGTYHR